MKKIEKQEGWRERIKFVTADEYGYDIYIDGEPMLNMENLGHELIDFISQLLSERTFSKEELKTIFGWASLLTHTQQRDNQLKEKVSKLLKEEE
jgi:hypothetical protein